MNWESQAPPAQSPAAGTRPAASPPPTAPAPTPAPMPTRPKGRFLVGAVLLAMFLSALFSIWDLLARTAVYGVVDGRVIHVSPEWSGVVEATHVREGDEVHQGQLLLTVRSMELRNELARVDDKLRLAQAQLEAQMAQMQWLSEQRTDRSQQAAGEYYELWSRLATARGQLKEKQAFARRLAAANHRTPGAVGEHQLEAARIATTAAEEQVKQLSQALKEQEERTEAYPESQRNLILQFQPQIAQVEALESEWERLRDLLDRAELRSPCNGRVAKVLRYSGEYAHKGNPLIEIVEHGSLEAIVYVPQDQSDRMQLGNHVHVRVTPDDRAVPCEVVAYGTRLEHAPPSICRYYEKDEQLLPVRLRPLPGLSHQPWRQGSKIRLPWDQLLPQEMAPVETRNVSATVESLESLESSESSESSETVEPRAASAHESAQPHDAGESLSPASLESPQRLTPAVFAPSDWRALAP